MSDINHLEFVACSQLEFDDSYTNYKSGVRRQIINHDGTKLCWKRFDPEGVMMLVQFCKRRGRLNRPQACLSKEETHCPDYNPIIHRVDVPFEETEDKDKQPMKSYYYRHILNPNSKWKSRSESEVRLLLSGWHDDVEEMIRYIQRKSPKGVRGTKLGEFAYK
jgi:hypothetical protein